MADVKPNDYIMGRIEERWIVGEVGSKERIWNGEGKKRICEREARWPVRNDGLDQPM